MVFTITDLKWAVDLYIFTTAYTRFWKLVPGTLIAILNPSIMPPPPGKGDTGRFSLALHSGDDTILEIGVSRDLGWCQSVKKDGKSCGTWVDKRHTNYCEWHVDQAVETTRRGRMEVNGMSTPYAPGGKQKGRTGFWGGRGKRKRNDDGLLREGRQWDRYTGSSYFIGHRPVGRGSAASLLDADGETFERGGSAQERARKRLAQQHREKEMAKQLGAGGNGLGQEYLRFKQDPIPPDKVPIGSDVDHVTEKKSMDVAVLGLLEKKRAHDVRLSPLKQKRKKMHSLNISVPTISWRSDQKADAKWAAGENSSDPDDLVIA